MRKYCIIFLILSSLSFAIHVYSQKESGFVIPAKLPQASGTNSGFATTADCDTINYPLPSNWSLIYYWVGSPAGDGYVAGTNGNNEKQKANYFDLSASSFNYIYGVLFYFGVANSSATVDLAKNVMFKVYADSAGSPGSQIGNSVNLQLSSIKTNVDSGIMTNVNFPVPIALSPSKKFYISVDLSNFSWNNGDSITLLTTKIDDVKPGTAWQQESNNAWKSMNDTYGNLALIILPYVSKTVGCNTLPVKLLSFNAEKDNNDVLINWQTSDEYNMKEYVIQKATNSNFFKTIGIISAFSGSKNEKYTFKDVNAFTKSPTVQYRLKQINKDGEIKYSKIILIKDFLLENIFVFPNPYNNELKLQINVTNAEMATVNIYDIRGLLVASEKPAFLNGMANTISVPSATILKRGVYFLKLLIDSKQFICKIVKE